MIDNKDFGQLPKEVQEIAMHKMAISATEKDLISALDGCEDLRNLTGTPPGKYMKVVDLIVRVYQCEQSKS